jgi:hypothetical protein
MSIEAYNSASRRCEEAGQVVDAALARLDAQLNPNPDTKQAENPDTLAAARECRGIARGLVRPARPRIVCLCGSTRFYEAFRKANFEETVAGRIILTVGCDFKSDDDLFAHMPWEQKITLKSRLDELHLRKIDLADEVLILNVGGYIGESTAREIAYARSARKPVRFLCDCDTCGWWHDVGDSGCACPDACEDHRSWKAIAPVGVRP